MSSNIIKKGTADEVRCAVTELRLSETFMGVPQLSVKVVSPVTVDIEIGDYIVYDYNGVTYTLRETPGREKHARPSTYGGAFVYNLVFHGPEWDLRNAPFLDLVLYDNGQHFTSMPDVTTYEDVYGIAARVQANIDNMYPGKWEIRVVSGLSADSTLAKRLSETQDFSLSDGKCLDALSQVYSQWGVSFVYSYESGKHVITIGGAETQEDTTGLFMYGRGNGLKVIKSSVQNASEIATRYYVYGGTQNMRPRYYNAQLYTPELLSQNTGADSSAIGELLLPMSVIGGSMYIPNLMIPISKWGKTKWYAWYNADSGLVFTEIRNPQQGQSYVFKNPNIGSFLGVVSGRGSDYVQYEGVNYSWVAEINFPDIRKAYIDAPQSYIDKYGIRPATMRFDGSGEREDIHPSIKGLTIGDIRAGLGSGAEYYPSTSVYTDPDERVDKLLSCDNPADDGLNTENGNKYIAEDSVSNNSIIMEYEMKVRNDGQRGFMKDKTYLSGNYGKITVTRKGYLDFRLPLVATVKNGEQYNITAGVEVYKTDTSGHLSLIIQYTTTNQPIKGDPEENIYFGLNIPDNKVTVDEGDILSISLWFQAVTDNVYLNTIKWTVPKFTMIWRYELSLDGYFYIKLKQIGFDISQISTNDGEYPVISMTSGQCGGYEFEIHDATYSASDDSWMLRCARVQDGTLGQWFPNNVFKIEPEDVFVLLNIALPRVYITSNEQHLYDTALAERLYEERPLLEPEIDNKVMAESPQVLHAGMWFSVKDTDLGLVGTDGDSYLILIDSVEVTDKPDAIRSFKVTLRNNKEDNVFTLMQKQIVRTSSSIRTERRNQTKTSVTKAPENNSSEGNVNSADFVTLSTAQTITGKKTFAEDAVFGADGSRLFIPSGDTPGTYDIFVNPGMAVEGEDPSAGGTETETEVYRLNGLTALAAGASSSAIENAIGSFSGLLEAVRAGMVIIDVPDAANGERKTAVWAMTSGSILVGMDFHTAPGKVTRYAVTNVASGLTLAIRAYSLLTEDGTLNGLSTDAKTVPGAINELHEKVGNGGAYLLNGVFANLSETSSDAEIKATIGSYDALRQAIVDRRVILDNYNVDYDSSPITVLQATDGGDEDFISLTAMNAEKYRSITIMRGADGTLSVSGMLERSWLSDEAYGQLNTENKTVLGAINELAEKASEGGGGGASPFWYGRVSATGTATKLGGTGTVTVTRTSEGLYSIPGLPGRIVIVTPLNYHALSILQQSMHTALVTQETSTGSATVNMFGADGTRDDYGFFMLII